MLTNRPCSRLGDRSTTCSLPMRSGEIPGCHQQRGLGRRQRVYDQLLQDLDRQGVRNEARTVDLAVEVIARPSRTSTSGDRQLARTPGGMMGDSGIHRRLGWHRAPVAVQGPRVQFDPARRSLIGRRDEGPFPQEQRAWVGSGVSRLRVRSSNDCQPRAQAKSRRRGRHRWSRTTCGVDFSSVGQTMAAMEKLAS